MQLRAVLRPLGRALRPTLAHAVTLAAYVLLAAAAAAIPFLRAATDQAALGDALRGVPPGVQAADAAVVEVVTGIGPLAPGGQSLLTAPGAVKGFTDSVVLGQSFGPELSSGGSGFYPKITPLLSAGGTTVRARLVSVADPAARIRTTGPPGRTSGVWLPSDVAAGLGVTAGGTVEVGVLEGPDTGTRVRRALSVPVAGTYATDARRRPLAPDGSAFWTASWVRLPVDSELTSKPAALVVADFETARRITAVTQEPLLWTSFTTLDPPVPPDLATALRLREQVMDLDSRAAGRGQDGGGRITTDVVSGIPRLVADADSVAAQVRSTTTGQAWAGVGLGLAVVLGLASLVARRRRTELRAVAAQGQHPLGTALRWTAATLPLAALAVVPGTLAARAGARSVYPVDTPPELWRAAVERAGTAAAVGLAAAFAVTAVAAAVAARPVRAGTPARTVPWPYLLAAAAAAAAAGVLTRQDPGQGLDVVAPVLVVAAVAAVGARAVAAGLSAAAARVAARPATRLPAVPLLALRRAGRGGAAGGPVVTAFAAGLGLLLFALTTSAGVVAAADEKAGVVAGAQARCRVDASWVVDPTAPKRPDDPSRGRTPPPKPAVRMPPLPAGTTVVWRDSADVLTTGDLPTMYAVDPAGFDAAARWGRSPDLAAGRAALGVLARAAAERQEELTRTGANGVVPVLAVGTFTARRGDTVTVSTGPLRFSAEIVATAPAFPGLARRDSLLVVPAEALFTVVGLDDPRLAGNKDIGVEVWSRDGVPGLRRVLDPVAVPLRDVVSFARERQAPAFVAARRSAQYRDLLGLLAAAVAVAALLAGVDRTLVEGRAEDVLLDRMGLRRAGVARARLLESGTLVAAAGLLAVAGTAVAVAVSERMVDPDAGLTPRIAIGPDGTAALVTLATAVVAWLATLALVVRRTRADDAAEVLRDAR